MAIASLVLFSLAVTVLLVFGFLWGELMSILHMSQIEVERFFAIRAFAPSISGLILGIQSLRSGKRRKMGKVGTVLNSIAVGFTSFFLVIVYIPAF